MNYFDYTLKMNELERLTTKVAKQKFIKEITYTWRTEMDPTYNHIQLMANTYLKFQHEKITGLNTLLNSINKFIIEVLDEENIHELILPKYSLPELKDYRVFMDSPSIPAYIKVAVALAEREAVTPK